MCPGTPTPWGTVRGSKMLAISRHLQVLVLGVLVLGPVIHDTQVKSSVRMKKTQKSFKWIFLGNFIPEIESKAPN